MITNAAQSLFNSIKFFSDLNKLIEEGESESIFLECKSPEQPILSKDLQITLSKAISGFSNTNGGIIIWGVSTTKKKASGLDVLTQVEPVGRCIGFAKEIENKIPALSIPSIFNFKNKIIKEKKGHTRGVIITYIPPVIGDPIQSIKDQHFYYRPGDEFLTTPYQMLKRLFASSESPDVKIIIPETIVKKTSNGFWNIPITITNLSSAVGEYVKINIEIKNPDACLEVNSKNISDISNLNPGKKLYSGSLRNDVIHREFNVAIGNLEIKMKNRKTKVVLHINIFANKMRAKTQVFDIKLYKSKFTTKLIKETYLY